MLDSRGRDTTALRSIHLETGQEETIFSTDKADVSGILSHPTESTIEAVSYTYDREKWEVLDQQIEADLDYLKTVEDGELDVTSRTLKDDLWTVAYSVDDGPVKFYLYDRSHQKAEFLFSHRPELENVKLAKMHPVIIKSRDGLDLVSYLTLPVGSDQKTGRSTGSAATDGPVGSRWPLGAGRLGLQYVAPVAGQSWIRGPVGQLPRQHGIRQEIHQCRQ